MTPYQYVRNNPINLIDPTGMIWEDPEEAQRLNKAVNNRIENINHNTAKLENEINTGKGKFLFFSYSLSEEQISSKKDKIAENGQKIELLNQSIKDIETIGKASETYRLSGPSKSDGTHGVVKGTDGVIRIEGSDTGMHIHEIRHIGQSIEAGGVKFSKDGRLLNSARTFEGARNNEVNAYQTQYSFDGFILQRLVL